MGVRTRSASDVHGFKVAGFDDAHSDGVGCGVVTQRHQQIPSTPLQKRHAAALLTNPPFASASFISHDFGRVFLPVAPRPPSVYLSTSPYSPFLLFSHQHVLCHVSPRSITAARNDITHYVLSPPPPPPPPLLSSPFCSSSLQETAAAILLMRVSVGLLGRQTSSCCLSLAKGEQDRP